MTTGDLVFFYWVGVRRSRLGRRRVSFFKMFDGAHFSYQSQSDPFGSMISLLRFLKDSVIKNLGMEISTFNHIFANAKWNMHVERSVHEVCHYKLEAFQNSDTLRTIVTYIHNCLVIEGNLPPLITTPNLEFFFPLESLLHLFPLDNIWPGLAINCWRDSTKYPWSTRWLLQSLYQCRVFGIKGSLTKVECIWRW